MPAAVLVAADVDPGALADVERQLVQRYERDYRVEAAADPAEAFQKLEQLAGDENEVALVLVGEALFRASGTELLERAHRLHPHAKRGLVVPGGAWEHRPSAEAILDSMAVGRLDCYVPRPVISPDEVFHQTISSVLLEWATERRLVPQTVHIARLRTPSAWPIPSKAGSCWLAQARRRSSR
jgi:thioredoxin reductase (NADPH)